MTEQPQHNREHGIAVFKAVCEETGIKITPQRLEVFLELLSARDHPSAEEIFTRVRDRMPTVSLDTVYRTLATFESRRVIAKLHVTDEKARYDATVEQHHHLVCRVCQKITDFEWPDVDQSAIPEEVRDWGRIEERDIHLRGVCEECLKKSED